MFDIFLWTAVAKLIDGGHRLVLVVQLHHTQSYKIVQMHKEEMDVPSLEE